jgi:hypothetical protein
MTERMQQCRCIVFMSVTRNPVRKSEEGQLWVRVAGRLR